MMGHEALLLAREVAVVVVFVMSVTLKAGRYCML
jgi:hypothetical protein